jgi:chemotaxis protein MotB
MAAGKRKGRGDDHEEQHADERWLLTYADMITLLMALFMVMFAMSSVNEQKFESLQKSLADAFSGRILGGESIQETGGSVQNEQTNQAVQEQTLSPMPSSSPQAAAEQEDFRRLKAQIDAAVAEQGLGKRVETVIERRGLAVRVMTDGLLFDSGSAVVKTEAAPLLRKVGEILSTDKVHPVRVEGHTDDVPVSGLYPSNWELSTARSSAVIRTFDDGDVPIPSKRFEAVGRSDAEPLASNATEAGRAKNRRVEIVLPRRHAEPAPPTPQEAIAAAVRPETPSIAREASR